MAIKRGASLLYLGRRAKKFKRPLLQRIQTVLDARSFPVEAYRTSAIPAALEAFNEGRCVRCDQSYFAPVSKMYKAREFLVRERGSTYKERGVARIHNGCVPGE